MLEAQKSVNLEKVVIKKIAFTISVNILRSLEIYGCSRKAGRTQGQSGLLSTPVGKPNEAVVYIVELINSLFTPPAVL